MKRLFICLLLTAFLPLAASTTQNSSTYSTPFATAVFAGHTNAGTWCECGTPNCICDPGERPKKITRRGKQNQEELPENSAPEQGIDFGAVALMLVFFAMTLSRLRG